MMKKLLLLGTIALMCSTLLPVGGASAQPIIESRLDVMALVAAGEAELVHTDFDIGTVDLVFDGNDQTLVRTPSINPAFTQVAFSEPKTLSRFHVCFSHALLHQFKLEAADNVEDLEGQTGSYQLLQDWTELDGSDLPAPNVACMDVELDVPVDAGAVRMTVERLSGDDYVHINEFGIYAQLGVESLLLSPDQLNVAVEMERALTLFAQLEAGEQVELAATEAVWSSADDGIAEVDASGMVTAHTWGETEVTATIGELEATVPVLVCDCTEPVDDLEISSSDTLCSGNYAAEDPGEDGFLRIVEDGVELVAAGVRLDGMGSYSGYGVVIDSRENVLLRGIELTGYHYGVKITGSSDITVRQVRSHGNKKETEGWLLITEPTQHGGGILLLESDGCLIEDNPDLTDQNVGVELQNSHHNTVRNNVANHCTAWGIRLYASDHNTIENNEAHHCIRGGGNDAAGMLLVQGSDRNIIEGNDLRWGGDGFFIGNEHGEPSNHNLIVGNDGSFSPHNAFEATFSDSNVFEDNIANDSHYGFWLGYSFNNIVRGNEIRNNRADGIAIDRGFFNTIEENTFSGNVNNIHLWQGSPPVPGYGDHESHHYTLRENVFESGDYGITAANTDSVTIERNVIEGVDIALNFSGDGNGIVVHENDLLPVSNTALYNGLTGGNVVDATRNWWGTTDEGEIQTLIYDIQDNDNFGWTLYDPWLDQSFLGVEDGQAPALPGRTEFVAIYPNPFNSSATVRFQIARTEQVELELVNLLGRRVATLHQGVLAAGEHALTLKGTELSSGTYFLRLQGSVEGDVRRVMLLK